MARTLVVAILAVGISFLTAEEPARKPSPVSAKPVTLSRSAQPAEIAAEIRQQTGLPLELKSVGPAPISVDFERTPFWTAVDELAAKTGTRPTFEAGVVKLIKPPAGPAPPSAVDGPFRVVVKKVVARRDYETGVTEHEVHLDLMWEPRFPVYLVDAEPTIASATIGERKLKATPPTGRVQPTGFSHASVIRLQGVRPGSTRIETLSGTFRVVAAEKMLAVEFADLTSEQSVSKTADGVKVTLQPVRKLEQRMEIGFDLEYPASHPEFESYQLWAGSNKLRLIAPDNRTVITPSDFYTDENGRRVRAGYNFTGPNGQPYTPPNLKGWRAVYETPCPLVEQTVTFTLKDIELP